MKAIPSTRFAPTIVVLVTALGVPAGAWAGQATAPEPPQNAIAEANIAEAYNQFLLGSFLEGEDDADGAIAALKKALDLDPGAAGAAAELADLYVRLNRADDALQAANQALSIDPENASAHQTLGFIYAGRLDDRTRGAARSQAQNQNATLAIEHLEKAVANAEGQADANVRATLARLYVRGDDYQKAIPLLTTLVNQEPGWRDGPELLLQAFVGAGRTPDAIAWLEQHAPDDPNLYPTLGNFYDRAHRWQDAADAYAAAIKVAPRNADLRLRYASSLMNAGGREALEQARDALAEAVDLRPQNVRALYLMSEAERRLGDLDAAEATARKAIAQDANSAWGYYALAEALEQRGRFAEIVGELAPAVTKLRESGDAASRDLAMLLPHLGYAYQETQEFDKAIETFEEARKLSPQDGSVLGYLISANMAAKRYTQAAALAREARAGRPDDVRLALLEGQALVRGGKVNDGVQVLQDLVTRNAGNPTAYIALSELYEDAERDSDAVRVLRDARSKFPKNTNIPFQLGAALERQKKFDEAEAAFRDTIAMDPEHAPALNYLGYMLAERGVRLDESVAYLKRALAIEPDNGAYLDSIGWAYFKADNLPLAEDNLRRAADQLTTNSVIQDHYGDVLARLERYADAIGAWTRALNGDGESIDRGDIEKKIRSARQKLGNR